MPLIRILLVVALVLAGAASDSSAHFGLARKGGSAGAPAPVITFGAPSASYIYPAAGGTALTTVTATVTAGPFLGGGGTFTTSNCPASNISVASAGAVTVTTSNLTLSQSCLITANYPGAVSVTRTFTLTGTQQTIASITPCSLGAGCSYTFTVPASPATLGAVPAVTMSGGISFAAGGGTIVLGSGLQCSNFAVSGSNLQITAASAATYACTYVITDSNASNSPQIPSISAVGSTSSGVVAQVSLVNGGSGTSPGPGSVSPVHIFAPFAPGAVPYSGTPQIAVPYVSGVALTNYQADCAVDGVNPLRADGCPSWSDGSLRGIPMSAFVPQLASAGTQTVQWKIQAGSYSTTSAIRPSDIIAASDYKSVLTNVTNAWVPQPYGEWPNGVQIGCAVSAGSVSGCTLRMTTPTVATSGDANCNSNGPSVPVGQGWIGTIDNGSGSPGNILTITTVHSFSPFAQGTGFLRGEILTDAGSVVAPNTVISKVIGAAYNNVLSTYTVSGAPQLVPSEEMGFIGCSGRVNNGINGTVFTTPAIFTTTLNANHFPTSVTLVTGGSGYTLVGSGSLTFDVNALLGLYGAIDPPTCAAEAGAGVFSSVTYSGGAVTVNTVTSGHIATGQIIKDSTGATAVVTGTSSPWAVSAALTSGAMTANTPVCIHSAGPVEKGYWMFGPYIDPNTGLADPQLFGSAEVDLWSFSGTPYSVRAIIRTDHEGWQPGNWLQSYTYNADIMNGTAEVRGNAQGSGIYTGITDQPPGDWWSADPALSGPLGASARMDWIGVTPNSFSESTNLATNAVNPYLASADINYFRSSHAMLPLKSSTTPSPLIIPISTTGGDWDNPVNFQGNYMPFGPSFIDTQTAYGSGGNHFFLTPQGSHLSFWIDAQGKASDNGLSWLNQMRVAGLALSGDLAGASESATGHALNIDPSFSNAAFTDPVRLNSALFEVTTSSVTSTFMNIGGQQNVHGYEGPYPDASHWPSGMLLGPYLVDGEYYQLKQMDMMSALTLWGQKDDVFRTLTFGGHSYYAVTWDTSSSRVWAWGLVLPLEFTTYAPPQEPDAQYWNWVVNNDNYQPYALFYPYTGSFTTGTGSGTKSAAWDSGCQGSVPAVLGPPNARPPYSVGETTWMCGYAAQVLLLAQDWAGGPGNNTSLDTLVTAAADNYLVKDGSQNSCAYNAVNYSQLTGDTSNENPATSFDNTDIPGSPPGSVGQVYRGAPAASLSSTASSSTVLFTPPNGGTAGPPAPITSGSILRPTQWDTTNEVADSPVPPSPLSTGTWYTWCSTSGVSPYTGTINPYGTNCSSPAPITLATTTNFNAGWIMNRSCIATGDNWGETGGFTGTPSYASDLWSVLNWRAAVGGATADTTTAISTFGAAGLSNPSIWPTLVNWDACTSYTC